jgi:hypothetical protein
MKYVRCLLIEKQDDYLRTTFKDDEYWSLPTSEDGYWYDPSYDDYYYDDWYWDCDDVIERDWNYDIDDYNLIEKYNKEYELKKTGEDPDVLPWVKIQRLINESRRKTYNRRR